MSFRSTLLLNLAILALFAAIWAGYLIVTEPSDQLHGSLVSDANNLVFAFASVVTASLISSGDSHFASEERISPEPKSSRNVVTTVMLVTTSVLVLTSLFSAAFVRMADALERAKQITFQSAGYAYIQREVGGSYFTLLTIVACLYFFRIGRLYNVSFRLTFSGAMLSSLLLIAINSALSGQLEILNGLELPDIGTSDTSKLVMSITKVGLAASLLAGFSFLWGGMLWISSALGRGVRRFA